MNYIEKQTLYYTIICAEILNQPYEVIFNKISPLFTCNESEYEKIKNFISNKEFLKLRSIQTIVMRINYIHSFSKENDIFGINGEEEESLLVKKSAYGFITELSKNILATTDLRLTVANIFEHDNKFAFLYSLILYCQNAKTDEIVSCLRKAIREGIIDAMIIAPYFVCDEQRINLITEIQRNNTAGLYSEIIERINKNYCNNMSMGVKGDVNNAE